MEQIISALNAAYQECGYVQKGSAPGLRYKFAGEAAFIEALRPVLIKHGIVVYQSGCEVVSTEGYTTSNGATMNRIIARFEFTFAHISGQSIKVTALGEGADSGDKTAPKCNTGALKYALRQTLLIETGDDPDAQSSDEQQRARPQRAPEPAKPSLSAKDRELVAGWLSDAENEPMMRAAWQDVVQAGLDCTEVRSMFAARKKALGL